MKHFILTIGIFFFLFFLVQTTLFSTMEENKKDLAEIRFKSREIQKGFGEYSQELLKKHKKEF
ncbi:hypothetical protein ACFL2K_03085 [Candidatus Margulisiibacteriota bacterium]